jgi:N-acyl-D-aspartate/D-glutamate deacylase
VLGLMGRSPWSGAAAWEELDGLDLPARLAFIADPINRARLTADDVRTPIPADRLYLLRPDQPQYRPDPDNTLAAEAARRRVEPIEAFLQFTEETAGKGMLNYPVLNQSWDAIEEMLSDSNVLLGLADAGAHVGQIMDASQSTWTLGHWVRDTGFWTIEEAIRRMTSDTAGVFGLRDRGVLAPGMAADVNVFDLDGLALSAPEFVHDFPGGTGRLLQRASGYEHTFVNGSEFMVRGEHTGEFAGAVLRSSS